MPMVQEYCIFVIKQLVFSYDHELGILVGIVRVCKMVVMVVLMGLIEIVGKCA